jgi:hypothetical protein
MTRLGLLPAGAMLMVFVPLPSITTNVLPPLVLTISPSAFTMRSALRARVREVRNCSPGSPANTTSTAGGGTLSVRTAISGTVGCRWFSA